MWPLSELEDVVCWVVGSRHQLPRTRRCVATRTNYDASHLLYATIAQMVYKDIWVDRPSCGIGRRNLAESLGRRPRVRAAISQVSRSKA